MDEAIKRIIEAMEEDEELRMKACEAWRNGADAAALATILQGAGTEATVTDVEAALTELMAREGRAIADQFKDIDEDELARIAGGGDYGNCTGRSYYTTACKATVESDESSCWGTDRCNFYNVDYKEFRVCENNAGWSLTECSGNVL